MNRYLTQLYHNYTIQLNTSTRYSTYSIISLPPLNSFLQFHLPRNSSTRPPRGRPVPLATRPRAEKESIPAPIVSESKSANVGRTRVDHRAKEARKEATMVTIICATDARQSWLCLDCERESKRRTERERERGERRKGWWKRDGETAHLHLLNAAVSTVRHVDGGANRGCPLAVGRGGRGETSLVGRSLPPRVSRGTRFLPASSQTRRQRGS